MSEERSDFVPDPDLSGVAVGEASVAPVVSNESEFPDEIENDIEGLLYLGAISSSVEKWGHKFEIHTLRAGEELARDQIVGEYENLLGQSKALGIATVAAAVRSVDGAPLQRALAPGKSDTISAIRANFAHFSNYYLPVIEFLYDEYEKLEIRQARAFKALEGK